MAWRYGNIQNFEEFKIKSTDFPLISSRRNPLLKRIRMLSKPKGRAEFSALLLEGTHLLEEGLKNGLKPLEIIFTPKWIENHHGILQSIPCDVDFYQVTAPLLEVALTTVNPDGVASVFSISSLPEANKKNSFVLALDRLQDPGNLGTLFRTALAADIEEVWLALGADPLGQKVLRASSGAVLQLPFIRMGSSEESAVGQLADKLKKAVNEGFQVVATYVPLDASYSPKIPYWELDWSKPTVLVLGNEGAGLHPIIKDCCTHGVTLPHSNSVESLNVAGAAVPLLLERRRAKMIFHKQ